MKSELRANALRPHNNPSFLSPDFHNLSQGPHFKETRMVRHNTRRQDALTNTTPKLPAVADSEKGRLKAAGLIPTIPLDQAPLSPKVERKYTYQPSKKVIPRKEDIYLTEAAGVPTNCSPFMYFQMRKYLRFPSA